MTLRLGIDLDGVVADFNTGWMTRYNAEQGTNLTPDQVTDWDAMIPLTHFASIDEFWRWARNGNGPGLFRHLPVLPGAHSALKRLSRNHQIVIVTTKPRWANAETFSWIGDNDIPTREVHIIGRKWLVDCDIYLDDGPHNLEGLVRHRSNRVVCRFVQPWNRPIPGVVDIASWEAFEDLVDRHTSTLGHKTPAR
jgi:5'(3')-deoxyribonucleotidase